MNITLVGAGNMGAALLKQLTQAGHSVRLTSRNSAKSAALATVYPRVRALPAAEALGDADIVIVATGYADAVPALRALGDLEGRIVIDITNPLSADYMSLTIGHTTSAAEEIAKAIPEATIVKAFNTTFAQVIEAGADFGGGNIASVFIASDSEPARRLVSELVESLGFKAIDAGGLKNARYLEPVAGLNIYFGYGAGQGTTIAPSWINRL